MFKKHIFLPIYSIVIVSFTVFLLFDTFVNTSVYEIVSINTSEAKDTGDIVSTSNSYKDDNISITLKEYNYNDTVVYVADVYLEDLSLLKTAFAKNAYGKNITDYTSSIASNVGAILAINGDYYGVQESGYVLKNGVLYRDTPMSGKQDLVIYKDGSWEIINESDVSANDLLNNGAYNIISFGPALINNGVITVSKTSEVGRAMASNPRTAIGKISDNHYVFVVSDGRTSESEGLTLFELAEFMQNLNCKIAYNLDGGGSSTLVFNGSVINNPTTNGNISERKISDIVYVGY